MRGSVIVVLSRKQKSRRRLGKSVALSAIYRMLALVQACFGRCPPERQCIGPTAESSRIIFGDEVIPAFILPDKAADFVQAPGAAAAAAVARDEFNDGVMRAFACMPFYYESQPFARRGFGMEIKMLRPGRRVPGCQQIRCQIENVGTVSGAHQCLNIGGGRPGVQRAAAGGVFPLAAAGAGGRVSVRPRHDRCYSRRQHPGRALQRDKA